MLKPILGVKKNHKGQPLYVNRNNHFLCIFQQNDPKDIELDKTVEEFSKVVEQEEKELQTPESSPQLKKTRKGRVIIPPNLDMPEPQSSVSSPVQTVTPITAKPKPDSDSASSSAVPDQTTMISELMKKNPDLFKGNKPVKIKVMTKDANGKSTVKFITVKASPAAAASTTSKGASPVTAKKPREGNTSVSIC